MPAYYLIWSIFGGWEPHDSAGNLMRLGAPYGVMPRRFRSERAAHKAIAKFYRQGKKLS